MLLLVLFAAATLIIGINTSWAFESARAQSAFSEEDPNDPGPEVVLMSLQYVYSEEDPNDPGPE